MPKDGGWLARVVRARGGRGPGGADESGWGCHVVNELERDGLGVDLPPARRESHVSQWCPCECARNLVGPLRSLMRYLSSERQHKNKPGTGTGLSPTPRPCRTTPTLTVLTLIALL